MATERVVVRDAQGLLTEKILIENAFPDKPVLKLWARSVYQQAHLAAQIPSDMNPAPSLPSKLAVKSIKAAASVVRNQLKRLCEERVPWLYELHPPEHLPEGEKRTYTRNRVKTLLNKGNYTHGEAHSRSKFFNHKALFNISHTYFYDSQKGFAQGRDTLFGPLFPINCIALIFTAIWSTIKSYGTGSFLSLEFSTKNCGSIFQHILHQLNSMELGHLNGVLHSICTRLFESRLEARALLDDLSGEDDYFDDDAFLADDDDSDSWPAN
ncbi:hypothetical protein DXG01_012981 [Tephrocybe rancida]|nr:hypothetical protein DXG01_012981 [Tephrocybe rancida]